MKKRGRRCLISLLLGLCLLMPSQMKVLAADAQEDSSSVQAVEEAMPEQENVATIDENQIDNTMQDDQDIAVQANTYPATGKITAKVYLRYSNAIPEKILTKLLLRVSLDHRVTILRILQLRWIWIRLIDSL